MNEFEVNCINKSDRNNQHESITHIGNSNGSWRLPKAEVVKRIEAKTENFYTLDSGTGHRVYIGVVREVDKNPYLRTYADGKWNNNLLAQPECGAACRIIALPFGV